MLTTIFIRRTGLAILMVLVLGGCEKLPRDPENTLASVRGQSIRIGILENPPWTSFEGGEVRGVEVELVKQLAARLDSDIAWVGGSESSLMPALERFELDLVIGGLTAGTPWNKKVGLSHSYYTTRFVLGDRANGSEGKIAGKQVAVSEHLPTLAAIVRERDVDVVTVPDLRATNIDLVAAPAWQLPLIEREPVGMELRREKHVMAVPPGENEWLLFLDRFLKRERGQVPDLLRQEQLEP